ncbi:hypothetical protein GW17_00035687 [Ensete ventricosum]|nr:hypothetical protein GW17_00035687 [Ensete ventricosum]
MNRVELFYAFLLRCRNEGSEEEGQPATASPHVGSATRRQPQGWPPLGRVAASGQGQLPPAKGQQRRRWRHKWGKRG